MRLSPLWRGSRRRTRAGRRGPKIGRRSQTTDEDFGKASAVRERVRFQPFTNVRSLPPTTATTGYAERRMAGKVPDEVARPIWCSARILAAFAANKALVPDRDTSEADAAWREVS